jgi:hypothetical protein
MMEESTRESIRKLNYVPDPQAFFPDVRGLHPGKTWRRADFRPQTPRIGNVIPTNGNVNRKPADLAPLST